MHLSSKMKLLTESNRILAGGDYREALGTELMPDADAPLADAAPEKRLPRRPPRP